MEHFTKATKTEIQAMAFMHPEYELLLDLLPEHLPMETIFYDAEYLCDVEIPKIINPLTEEITKLFSEKYPFLCVFGFDENMNHDYLDYYFSDIDCLGLSSELVEGTELELLENLYYRSEES